MLTRLVPRVTLVRLLQLPNTPVESLASPILRTLLGRAIEDSFEQDWNAEFPIVKTPVPIRILVRWVHPWKALLPMLVILSGTVTLVRTVLFKNAELPMLVTGQPFVVPGITTTPPEPV